MKIYDCFLFFNEIELLQLRLELLYPHVDYFIVSECDYTFSGLKKPFYFEENKSKFSKFLDKIIHVKIENSNETENFVNIYEGKQKEIYDLIVKLFKELKVDWKSQKHWCLDFLHREYVRLGMSSCEEDDIIVFSDLDEIPNPDFFINHLHNLDFEKIHVLVGDSFSFYINVMNQTDWHGAYITKYSKLKDVSVGLVRVDREKYSKINNMTWHFTNMGGEERVITKIKSWGHQEFNYPYLLSTIKNKIENLTDAFGRSNNSYSDNKKYFFEKMKVMNVDTIFPDKLIDTVRKNFPHFIKE